MLPFLAKESLSLQTSVNTKTPKGERERKSATKKSKATKTKKVGKKEVRKIKRKTDLFEDKNKNKQEYYLRPTFSVPAFGKEKLEKKLPVLT